MKLLVREVRRKKKAQRKPFPFGVGGQSEVILSQMTDSKCEIASELGAKSCDPTCDSETVLCKMPTRSTPIVKVPRELCENDVVRWEQSMSPMRPPD